jgi:hypothetical protein
MWDTRGEVKQVLPPPSTISTLYISIGRHFVLTFKRFCFSKGATDATLKSLNTCQNRDIRPFIPAVIEAIKNPEEVPETLHKLSSTVFVQSVDNSAHILKSPLHSSCVQYTHKGTDFRETCVRPCPSPSPFSCVGVRRRRLRASGACVSSPTTCASSLITRTRPRHTCRSSSRKSSGWRMKCRTPRHTFSKTKVKKFNNKKAAGG